MSVRLVATYCILDEDIKERVKIGGGNAFLGTFVPSHPVTSLHHAASTIVAEHPFPTRARERFIGTRNVLRETPPA